MSYAERLVGSSVAVCTWEQVSHRRAGRCLDAKRACVLREALGRGSDPHAAAAAGTGLSGTRGIDPLVSAAVIALGKPRAQVGEVAEELGLSARQLQRRITDAVGYGPKMLQRVLRFRRLQALPRAPTAA